MSGKLDGRTAIVTGSSRGIGKSIAHRFAEEGANVVVTSRSSEQADNVADEIAAELDVSGGTVLGVEVDVADYEAVQSLVDAAVAEFGRLDIMVNNAGVTRIAPATELTPEDWRQVVDVDLTGVFFGSQLAGRQMIAQGEGGAILNISSMLGKMGFQKRAPYCAAKAGVNNLTRTLAVEWAEHDIQVNGLAPGFIKTDITDQTQDSAGYTDKDIHNRTPLGRFGTLDEMAECALFLVSNNHYVTGETLHADGGWTAFAWGSKGK